MQKPQQDPTSTLSISMVEVRPNQSVDQHDYHIMKQGKVQDTHDHDRYIGPYSTIQQQIRADAMLSRNFTKKNKTI